MTDGAAVSQHKGPFVMGKGDRERFKGSVPCISGFSDDAHSRSRRNGEKSLVKEKLQFRWMIFGYGNPIFGPEVIRLQRKLYPQVVMDRAVSQSLCAEHKRGNCLGHKKDEGT